VDYFNFNLESRYKGKTMTTAEMATYVYDQIDQVRAELN
jgi:hypothetical protein